MAVGSPLREKESDDRCSDAYYTGTRDEDVGTALVAEPLLVFGAIGAPPGTLGVTSSEPGLFTVSIPLQMVTPPSTAVAPKPTQNSGGGEPTFRLLGGHCAAGVREPGAQPGR